MKGPSNGRNNQQNDIRGQFSNPKNRFGLTRNFRIVKNLITQKSQN